jgi:hypothetical protein
MARNVGSSTMVKIYQSLSNQYVAQFNLLCLTDFKISALADGVKPRMNGKDMPGLDSFKSILAKELDPKVGVKTNTVFW